MVVARHRKRGAKGHGGGREAEHGNPRAVARLGDAAEAGARRVVGNLQDRLQPPCRQRVRGLGNLRGLVGTHRDELDAHGGQTRLPLGAEVGAVGLAGTEHGAHAPQSGNRGACHLDHAVPVGADLRTGHVRQMVGLGLARACGDSRGTQREHDRLVGHAPQGRLQRGSREGDHDVGTLLGDGRGHGVERARVELRVAERHAAVDAVDVAEPRPLLEEPRVALLEVGRAVVGEACDRWHGRAGCRALCTGFRAQRCQRRQCGGGCLLERWHLQHGRLAGGVDLRRPRPQLWREQP